MMQILQFADIKQYKHQGGDCWQNAAGKCNMFGNDTIVWRHMALAVEQHADIHMVVVCLIHTCTNGRLVSMAFSDSSRTR